MQVPVDTWPKSADRMLEVAGLLIAASHVVFLVLLVLWFGVNRPGTWKLFKARLGAAMRGRPMPERLPGGVQYETRIYRPTGPDLPKRGTPERKALMELSDARRRARGPQG